MDESGRGGTPARSLGGIEIVPLRWENRLDLCQVHLDSHANEDSFNAVDRFIRQRRKATLPLKTNSILYGEGRLGGDFRPSSLLLGSVKSCRHSGGALLRGLKRICHSKSPYASRFFFIKKKDGKFRPVQDYQNLNKWTIPNKYPLPLIPELIHKISGKQWFTKFDVQWGYNNVHIKEGNEWKAAFKTSNGLFKPTIMFFELTNSPATFQTMMDDKLKEEIDSGDVSVYMDDIVIHTNGTLENHMHYVE